MARLEKHWTDLLRTAISIREGRVSSVTLLRRLGNHSHKNRLYRAFRELGRVIRMVTLLRYLSEPGLREQITAIEAFHGYSEWLMIGGTLIGHNDPDHQERVVKFNALHPAHHPPHGRPRAQPVPARGNARDQAGLGAARAVRAAHMTGNHS
jgi:hypothetical protein